MFWRISGVLCALLGVSIIILIGNAHRDAPDLNLFAAYPGPWLCAVVLIIFGINIIPDNVPTRRK